MKTNYLDVYRALHGRARSITRNQLSELLLLLADSGLDLRGHAGWYGADGADDLPSIARAIAQAPRGITLLSLGGQVRDIQHDEPGRMHPMQMAQISFVSQDLGHNSLSFVRRHARRVVTVI